MTVLAKLVPGEAERVVPGGTKPPRVKWALRAERPRWKHHHLTEVRAWMVSHISQDSPEVDEERGSNSLIGSNVGPVCMSSTSLASGIIPASKSRVSEYSRAATPS